MPNRFPMLGIAEFALALICLLASGCTDQDDILPVVEGLDSGEPELAEFLADQLDSVRARPRSGLVRGSLGMAYDANDFADAAAATYDQARTLAPKDFRWPYYRALLLARSGDNEEALQSLDRALDIDVNYAPAWLWRGTWLLDVGRDTDAETAFRRALDLADNDTIVIAANSGLARTLLRKGLADEAVTLLEPIAAKFDHPYPLRLLARAYRDLGREEDARRASSYSREAKPLHWQDERRHAVQEYVRGFSGRLRAAEALINRGMPGAALKILEILRESQPTDRTLLNNLAVAYGLTDRQEEAFDVLLAALARYADYYLFHFNIATIYEQRGDPDQALQHVNRTLELQPSFRDAHQRKIALLMDQNRYDDALKAINVADYQGEQGPETLFYAGVVEGTREQWPEAIKRFQQVVRLDPEFTKGHLYLGRSFSEAGRFEEARVALARADALGAQSRDVADARMRLRNLEFGDP